MVWVIRHDVLMDHGSATPNTADPTNKSNPVYQLATANCSCYQAYRESALQAP